MKKLVVNAELKEVQAKPKAAKPKSKLAGLYLALLVAGSMLVGQSLEAFLMWNMRTRLGLAFLTTVLIMVLSKERAVLGAALIILWGGFLVTMMR